MNPKRIKRLNILVMKGSLTWLYYRLRKIFNWNELQETTWEYIYEDCIYYEPRAIAIFDDYHPFDKFRHITQKYPFCFIFMPNRNIVIDTQYVPLRYDICSLIRSLVEEYKMTDQMIVNCLNFLGIKPYEHTRSKEFTLRNIRYLRYQVCNIKKDKAEWQAIQSSR